MSGKKAPVLYPGEGERRPLVSVLVLCYNYEKIVAEAIQSVLVQTYGNLEIIICDNGSQDRTRQVIERYAVEDARIVPIYLPVNQGVSGNFNACIDRATGEYIAVLCGDDVMLPDKIWQQVEFLETNPEYVVVLHAMDIFDSESGASIGQFGADDVLRSPTDWFFRADYIPQRRASAYPYSALFGRAEYLGAHRYDPRLPYKNEVLFAIDCYANRPLGKWYCLPEMLGRYRKHAGNLSSSREMNEALLEETFVLAGIVAARYPQFAGKIGKVRNTFLFRYLLYGSGDGETRRRYEELFRQCAGLPLYLFYSVCRGFRKCHLEHVFFKCCRIVIRA